MVDNMLFWVTRRNDRLPSTEACIMVVHQFRSTYRSLVCFIGLGPTARRDSAARPVDDGGNTEPPSEAAGGR